MTVYFVDGVMSEMKLYFMELDVFVEEAIQLFLLFCHDDLAYFLFLSLLSCFMVPAPTSFPHLLDLYSWYGTASVTPFCELTQTLKTDVFGTDITLHVDLQ
jgi:hypothetical protein